MTDSPLETWLQAFLDARGAAPELELRSWADSIPELSTDWRLRVELERRRHRRQLRQVRPHVVDDEVPRTFAASLGRGASR